MGNSRSCESLSVQQCVDHIITKTNGHVRLAVPLGVGKPIHFLNALYERVAAEPRLRLEIFTALTLSKPGAKHELARRFMSLVEPKLFGECPEIKYALDLKHSRVPKNITISEFYVQPGTIIGNQHSQRYFSCLNYSEVLEGLQKLNINTIGQLISPLSSDGQTFSLGLNTDISSDLFRVRDFENSFFVGEVNPRLPPFSGDAMVRRNQFDYLIEDVPPYDLFGIPHAPVTDVDYVIGLYTSVLIKDGGTIQIGIGSLGDAIAYALLLRHRHPEIYRKIIDAFDIHNRYGKLIDRWGGTQPFQTGLYACSEMLNDPLLELLQADIISRSVKDGKRAIKIHAGFGAGTQSFYRTLSENAALRESIGMTSVLYTNQMPSIELENDRRDARFCNTAMKVNLLGGASSDTLPSGEVVSGVGGQFDFALLPRHLKGARSLLLLRSTRTSKGRTTSNITWETGYETVPRTMRDIVVSEYGIADLKFKTDGEVAIALANISDAGFANDVVQHGLTNAKLPSDFKVPSLNRRDWLKEKLAPFKKQGYFPIYPFPTGLDETELRCLRALGHLSSSAPLKRLAMLAKTIGSAPLVKSDEEQLQRMGLGKPRGLREWACRKLLVSSLKEI